MGNNEAGSIEKEFEAKKKFQKHKKEKLVDLLFKQEEETKKYQQDAFKEKAESSRLRGENVNLKKELDSAKLTLKNKLSIIDNIAICANFYIKLNYPNVYYYDPNNFYNNDYVRKEAEEIKEQDFLFAEHIKELLK